MARIVFPDVFIGKIFFRHFRNFRYRRLFHSRLLDSGKDRTDAVSQLVLYILFICLGKCPAGIDLDIRRIDPVGCLCRHIRNRPAGCRRHFADGLRRIDALCRLFIFIRFGKDFFNFIDSGFRGNRSRNRLCHDRRRTDIAAVVSLLLIRRKRGQSHFQLHGLHDELAFGEPQNHVIAFGDAFIVLAVLFIKLGQFISPALRIFVILVFLQHLDLLIKRRAFPAHDLVLQDVF